MYEYADLIDSQDRVRTLIDPTSSYAIAAAYALGRAVDDEIIAACTGTAYTGERLALGLSNYTNPEASHCQEHTRTMHTLTINYISTLL